MAKTVDEYLNKHATWSHILQPLCQLLRESGLQETVKWGVAGVRTEWAQRGMTAIVNSRMD